MSYLIVQNGEIARVYLCQLMLLTSITGISIATTILGYDYQHAKPPELVLTAPGRAYQQLASVEYL